MKLQKDSQDVFSWIGIFLDPIQKVFPQFDFDVKVIKVNVLGLNLFQQGEFIFKYFTQKLSMAYQQPKLFSIKWKIQVLKITAPFTTYGVGKLTIRMALININCNS
jgi:hypothetical protein